MGLSMTCPQCGYENTHAESRCLKCGSSLVVSVEAETWVNWRRASGADETWVGNSQIESPRPGASSPPDTPAGDPSRFSYSGQFVPRATAVVPGQIDFGPRYRVEKLLGQGGMGAVYKAYDRDLDRTVALKLIRPELTLQPEFVMRFKQELLLASKISHKNILRIHDLGEAAGKRFISMAYIEGEDLSEVLRKTGRLPVPRVLNIARQLCAALEAAHSEGVIHRDFKPQNILLDRSDNVYVSDFGLAKSLAEEGGVTMTGELLGTPRYMAPEQIEGKKVDARTDLYALGLVIYEMVAGEIPFQNETTFTTMYKRANEAPPSPKLINPQAPDWLVGVIMKCLARDPAQRYQRAREILHDIETRRGPVVRKSVQIAIPRFGIEINRTVVGIVAAVLVLTGVLLAIPWVRHRIFPASAVSNAANRPVTVLVADFTNHTGDPVFDGTLEPMLNVALEGAKFVNAFNRGTARTLAEKLPHPTDRLDEQPARLVAVSQGISTVITGEISQRGNDYSVSAIALDAVTGKVIGTAAVSAPNKDQIVRKLPELAAPIRKALGDETPESIQLERAGGAFIAGSLEAVHQYGIGMERQFSGKMLEALQSFSKAAELDPNFARAYAGMAAASGNLGRRQDAEKYVKEAMAHVDRMTERERYRIRGQYYYRTGNWQKCVEEFGELVKQYPADNIGQNNLASCYVFLRNMPKGMEEAQRAVQIAPRDIAARVNYALDACYTGDFETCEREGREVQKLNPVYDEGYLVLAYAKLGQDHLGQAAEIYRNLEKVGGRGPSLSASGLANLALYEGRVRDAIDILEKSVAIDLAKKEPEQAADKFVMLAHAQLLGGQKQLAVTSAEKALASSQSAKIRFLAARTFLEAGEIGKARELAASLGRELLAEPQVYAKLILGEAALKEHHPQQAIQLFTEARDHIDTWIGHFDLGRAYLDGGAFTEADSEFDHCIKRRGEALELFMDDMPTYSYFPAVYYYQGQVREGLKSPGAADSYRTYLAIRGTAGEDPRLIEVRRRLGQ
jgi:serine/threonine protein kinase/tetratricopeptide (TPR) repeat protein